MHRTIGLAGVTLTLALAASPAAAQTRCTAPDEPGWHSCLTASHRLAEDGGAIHLTKVRPRLVVRYEEECPDGADRRTVAIRVRGEQLVRARVDSRCKRGVARYDVTLRLDLELPEGTVVRSFWSGIPDGARAPKVKLTD
jgi:hypothetical protein